MNAGAADLRGDPASIRDRPRPLPGDGIASEKGHRAMTSASKIRSNRENARKSTGPKDTSRTRYNGLKHGLRSDHVVLPGESHEEFDAERDAWFGDCKPITHIRAVLVERAVVASWRLRRCVRAEAALFARLADDAGRAYDREQLDRVDRDVDRFEDDPSAALSLLMSHAPGIDRLLRGWAEMAEALEQGPAGWDQRFHTRLMRLLGHPPGTNLFHAGDLATASARLLAARRPGIPPLPAGEAEATVASLRRKASEAIDQLREARRELPDRSRDRQWAMEAASADTSAEARLRHRYEMEHEKSLYAALRELRALAKSGLDLPDEPEPGPPATSPKAAPAERPPRQAAGWSGKKTDANIESPETYEELAGRSRPPPVARPGYNRGSPGSSKRAGRGRSGRRG